MNHLGGGGGSLAKVVKKTAFSDLQNISRGQSQVGKMVALEWRGARLTPWNRSWVKGSIKYMSTSHARFCNTKLYVFTSLAVSLAEQTGVARVGTCR